MIKPMARKLGFDDEAPLDDTRAPAVIEMDINAVVTKAHCVEANSVRR